jgi:hypothetical protein
VGRVRVKKLGMNFMLSRRSSGIAVVGVLGVLVAMTTACRGHRATAHDAGSATVARQGSASAGGSASAPVARVDLADACSVLTVAEVKAALALPGTVTSEPTPGSSGRCSYTYQAPSKAISPLGAFTLQLNATAESFGAFSGDGAPVAGLGDRAAYSEADHLLVVQQGTTVIAVSLMPPDNSAETARTATRALALLALGRVPTTATAAPTASTPPGDDPSCHALTAAQLASALTVQLDPGVPGYGGCLYYKAGTPHRGIPALSLVVRRGMPRAEVDRAIQSLAATAHRSPVTVTGVGDSAVAVDSYLWAFKGVAYISLQPGTPDITLENTKALARTALTSL